MVNTGTIRTVVGIIGNVLSFGLFASPGPTLWRIIKKKSTEEFKADPYIATVVNCLFWLFYGLPMVHPNSTLVLTINGIGLVMELIYLSIFLVYGNKKERVKIGICLMIEMLLICGVGALVLSLKHTHESRSNIVGAICVGFGIIMYGSPLTIMRKVIKTKSVEYMPFHLSLASTLNGTCWVIYGLLRFDLFILIANGAGVLLGLAQLILYAIYCKSTPKDDATATEKPTSVTGEVQLPRVESV